MEALAIIYMCSRSTTSKHNSLNSKLARWLLEGEIERHDGPILMNPSKDTLVYENGIAKGVIYNSGLKMPHQGKTQPRGITIITGARGGRGYLRSVAIALAVSMGDVHCVGVHDRRELSSELLIKDSKPMVLTMPERHFNLTPIEHLYKDKPWNETGGFSKFTKDKRKRH